MSKSERVRNYLVENPTAKGAEVAKMFNVSDALVSTVRKKMK